MRLSLLGVRETHMTLQQKHAILKVIAAESDRDTLSEIAGVIAARVSKIAPVSQSRTGRRTRSRVGRTVPNQKGFVNGDTVVFNHRTTRYLEGLEAEVVGTNAQSANVKTPDRPEYGRFRNKPAIRCPNDIIEKVPNRSRV